MPSNAFMALGRPNIAEGGETDGARMVASQCFGKVSHLLKLVAWTIQPLPIRPH